MSSPERNDAGKELLDAFRAYLAEIGSAPKQSSTDPGTPNWKVFAILVLIAFDLGLAVLWIDNRLPIPAAAVKVGIPAIFGAGVVTYSTYLRAAVERWSKIRWVPLVAGLPPLVYMLAFIPVPVRILTPEMSSVAIDGRRPVRGDDTNSSVAMRGLRRHTVIVSKPHEHGVYTDTFHFTLFDIWNGVWAKIPAVQTRFKLDPLKVLTKRTATISRGDSVHYDAEVTFIGLDALFLDPSDRRGGNRSLHGQLERGLGKANFKLPPGKYEVVIKRSGCAAVRLDQAFEVKDILSEDDDLPSIDVSKAPCRRLR